jgi:energy-coupling factor transporter ATP-binding protein EcfA2
MRYLNKIVFVNIANTQYAVVPINGKVHFVGNQGAGKSTILRALLVFYNADTQGLGITLSSDKKPFAEYYFKYDNSFIIYEVAKEQTAFCVVAYKSANSISYRFIAGPYQKDWFVDNNKAVESWEVIGKKLNEQQVFFTKRKIDEYKEYRDILYGNTDSKKSEFKQFALMETKEYQYVYKTI